MNQLKLTIDLVPSTAWGQSLANYFKGSKWDKIKQNIFANEGKQCWICNNQDTKRFEAHEYWEYDETSHIQKLVAIHHLCSACHRVKHIGFWIYTDEGRDKLDAMGKSPYDLTSHFCKVNNCSIDEYNKHLNESFDIYDRRSLINWKQDFSKYE